MPRTLPFCPAPQAGPEGVCTRYDATTDRKIARRGGAGSQNVTEEISRMLVVEPARDGKIVVCLTNFGGKWIPWRFQSGLNEEGLQYSTDAKTLAIQETHRMRPVDPAKALAKAQAQLAKAQARVEALTRTVVAR
jgi:hypothetical protein